LEDNMTPEREAEIRAHIAAFDDARAERDALRARWGATEADIAHAEAACDANPTSAEALRARVMADPVAASAYWQHRAERLTRERDEARRALARLRALYEAATAHVLGDAAVAARSRAGVSLLGEVPGLLDAVEQAEHKVADAIARAEAAEAREAALREAAARAQEATALLAFPMSAHALITERERADEALRAVLRDPSPRVAVLLAARKVAEAALPLYVADEPFEGDRVEPLFVALADYEAAVKVAKGER
jgi:hypothetical protein